MNLYLAIYTDILACMAFYNGNWMMLILVIVDVCLSSLVTTLIFCTQLLSCLTWCLRTVNNSGLFYILMSNECLADVYVLGC